MTDSRNRPRTTTKNLAAIWRETCLKEGIEVLKLSAQSCASLRQANICLISDLISRTETELLRSCDLNSKDWDEIQAKLRRYCNANGIPFPWRDNSSKETDTTKNANARQSNHQLGMPAWGTWMDRISPDVSTYEVLQSLGSETDTDRKSVV